MEAQEQLKPTDIYEELVHEKGFSLFGEVDMKVHYTSLVNGPKLLKTFWEDNDVQEITITSTNMGFSKTLTKQYKQNGSAK